jgi:hypothetical protein
MFLLLLSHVYSKAGPGGGGEGRRYFYVDEMGGLKQDSAKCDSTRKQPTSAPRSQMPLKHMKNGKCGVYKVNQALGIFRSTVPEYGAECPGFADAEGKENPQLGCVVKHRRMHSCIVATR